MHDVKVASPKDGIGRVFLFCKSWASQKKKTVKYEQKVIFSSDTDSIVKFPACKVDFATCEVCPAGLHGGLCQHVFALLMAIEHYRCREDVAALPGAEPVTSVRQSWEPRERDVEPQAIFQSVVERAKGSERKRKAVSS